MIVLTEPLHLSGLGTIPLTDEVLLSISILRIKLTEFEEVKAIFIMKNDTISSLERDNRNKRLHVNELDKVKDLI